MTLAAACVTMLLAGALPADRLPNPMERPVRIERIQRWEFDRTAGGWVARHDCRASVQSGRLVIESTGTDPYLHCPLDAAGGLLLLRIRARSRTAGGGAVYWATDRGSWSEQRSRRFPLEHDGQWREYEVSFVVDGRLNGLRLDPGSAAGVFEIDWMELVRKVPHPLSIEPADTTGPEVEFLVRNDSARPIGFSALGRQWTLAAGEARPFRVARQQRAPLEAVSLRVTVEGFAPLERTVFVHNASVPARWIERPLGDCTLRVADDGSAARIERGGRLVALVGPLAHIGGELPKLRLVDADDNVRFEGEDIKLELATSGAELLVSIDSRRPCTGPVVRAVGRLEQGLFAGLEYLGKGEQSSSTLDIETEDHLRYAPDPLKVTMPLMVMATDRATMAMTWTDMSLQPLYATPNFFDGAADHRMALRGRRVQAAIRVDQQPLEEAIAWAVRRRGLPPLPPAPRTAEEQRQLCLAALDGPLRTAAGWGHCAEPRWPRRPYADMASCLWRLSGQVPQLDHLVPGGAHVRNDAIWFVTGRARQWLQIRSQQVQQIIRRQQPDGSFRYRGQYQRGHFEDTASGYCARPAADLLEYAWLTGDRQALQAGLRALDFMKRFRTPRGAQTWELSLHTPDQLASAYLVWAYVRGYQLTGDESYLKQARRWALSGVPFVYLWSRYPIMAYATVPVYGATNWRAPLWIGRPVQWVGGVYAYALALLAPYDQTLDWRRLARGILICAQQMQYPDGQYAGLLPDAFLLESQQRLPARINPCALVSLEMALEGEVDSLAVASDGKHRVVASLRVSIRDGTAVVQGKPGLDYQVLIDGSRVIDVHSRGEDRIPLE